jgi:hypothetical protein
MLIIYFILKNNKKKIGIANVELIITPPEQNALNVIFLN